jgi:hypothetical protein
MDVQSLEIINGTWYSPHHKMNLLGCFFLFFFTLKGFASETSSIVDHMQERIEALGEETNFVFVDLGMSETDLAMIRQFNVEAPGQYDRFGNLLLLREELPNFLRKSGRNSESLVQKITETIFSIASRVNKASNKETAWVCVRASIPNHLFDMPRWHKDGYYHSPYAGFAFKFAATLKGNPTLFYQLPQEMRAVFRSYSGDREFLSHLLNTDAIELPKFGQGAFFIVGDEDNGAAHSEPKMDGERLFFSVLPGNENEIEELRVCWQR